MKGLSQLIDFWRFCRHWAMWIQQTLRTWRKIRRNSRHEGHWAQRSGWWEPHRNAVHRVLCWPQWDPSFMLAGRKHGVSPRSPHCTSLLLSWVCGDPGTFPTWGTVWNSRLERRVPSPGRNEASEPKQSIVTLPLHIPPATRPPFLENVSLFLFPSGTSSTRHAETLIVPNPQRSFYDLPNPVLFFLDDGEGFIFLSSQEARENINVYTPFLIEFCHMRNGV